MKTFKHKASNVLATLTEKTVWMSDIEGNIYKQFPIQHLILDQFENSTIEFPGDFNEQKAKFLMAQSCKRAEKEREAEERRRIAEENRRRETLNLWNIRKAFMAGQPVYGIQVDLYECKGDDNEHLHVVEGYPQYFADKAEYEKALAEARTLKLWSGEEHNICHGQVRPSTTWLDFLDEDYNFFDIMDNFDNQNYYDEWHEYDYPALGDEAIIVEWSWKPYVGYSRKLEGVYPAWRLGFKTEKDLITGNEESTFRRNYSLLLSADEVKDYCYGIEYDAEVAEMIADKLNESHWKWEYYANFNADKVRDRFDVDFVSEEEED